MEKPAPSPPGRHRAMPGYSLVELVIVLALAGVFFAVAMPAFTSAIESHHRNTIAARLMEDLALARLQAIAISSNVALCGKHPTIALTCLDAASTDWSDGWYVYAGNSASISAAAAVLRAPQSLPEGWVVDKHVANSAYLALGPRSETSQFGHFTIYRSGYSTTAGCVTVNSTGRARFSAAPVSSGTVSSANDPC